MLNNSIYKLTDDNGEMTIQEVEENLFRSLKILNEEIENSTAYMIQNLSEITTSITEFSKSVPLMGEL